MTTECPYKRRRVESGVMDLALGDWMEKAEERCLRSGNFQRYLEKDRARTIRTDGNL